MTKRYTIDVIVTHRVYDIEANSIEEAEEQAYEEFLHDSDRWDDIDYWVSEVEEVDDDAA